MLRKIQQIPQPHAIVQSSLGSQIQVETQHKLKVNLVVRSVVYNLICICLFIFRDDIKDVFYLLNVSGIFNFLVDVVVDILTTMLLVHIVGSFIEYLLKKLAIL